MDSSQIALGAVDTENYTFPIRIYASATRSDVGGLTARKISLSTGDTGPFAIENQGVFIEDVNIRLPKAFRDSILTFMNASQDTSGGAWHVSCENAKQRALYISGRRNYNRP